MFGYLRRLHSCAVGSIASFYLRHFLSLHSYVNIMSQPTKTRDCPPGLKLLAPVCRFMHTQPEPKLHETHRTSSLTLSHLRSPPLANHHMAAQAISSIHSRHRYPNVRASHMRSPQVTISHLKPQKVASSTLNAAQAISSYHRQAQITTWRHKPYQAFKAGTGSQMTVRAT
jgi:hypothetical protein